MAESAEALMAPIIAAGAAGGDDEHTGESTAWRTAGLSTRLPHATHSSTASCWSWRAASPEAVAAPPASSSAAAAGSVILTPAAVRSCTPAKTDAALAEEGENGTQSDTHEQRRTKKARRRRRRTANKHPANARAHPHARTIYYNINFLAGEMRRGEHLQQV